MPFPGLSPQEFQGLLSSPQFDETLRRAIAHTAEHNDSVAFGAYAGPNQNIVVAQPLITHDLRHLTLNDQHDIRSDVLATVHTHSRTSWTGDMPTKDDLVNHCRTNQASRGLVSLVVVPGPKNSDISSVHMVRAARHPDDLMTWHVDSLRPNARAEQINHAITSTGLLAVRATFHRRAAAPFRFLPRPNVLAAELFPKL